MSVGHMSDEQRCERRISVGCAEIYTERARTCTSRNMSLLQDSLPFREMSQTSVAGSSRAAPMGRFKVEEPSRDREKSEVRPTYARQRGYRRGHYR